MSVTTKKQTKKRGRPVSGRKDDYIVHVRLPEELGHTIDFFISAQELQPTLRQLVQRSLQEYLAKHGFGELADLEGKTKK